MDSDMTPEELFDAVYGERPYRTRRREVEKIVSAVLDKIADAVIEGRAVTVAPGITVQGI